MPRIGQVFFSSFSLSFFWWGEEERGGGPHYIVHMVFASMDAVAEPRPFFWGGGEDGFRLGLSPLPGGQDGSLYIHHREATFISAAPRQNTY